MSTDLAPRPISAIAFIVSGVAILLAILVFVTAVIPDSGWLYLIAFAAMIVALAVLAKDELTNGTAKTGAIFAALGWTILLVATLITALPGIVSSSAYFVVFVASLVTAGVVLARQQLTPQARIATVALLIVTALYMVSAFFGIYGAFAALFTILLGIFAVVAGYLLYNHR